jgi:hypothetical protein
MTAQIIPIDRSRFREDNVLRGPAQVVKFPAADVRVMFADPEWRPILRSMFADKLVWLEAFKETSQ